MFLALMFLSWLLLFISFYLFLALGLIFYKSNRQHSVTKAKISRKPKKAHAHNCETDQVWEDIFTTTVSDGDIRGISEGINRANWNRLELPGKVVKLLMTCVRLEVFTAVTMKNGVFWDVMPCGSCKNRRFGGT
jgi:hypothetical protein